jgi:DNA (cytosine-5)-methyltransferase 1
MKPRLLDLFSGAGGAGMGYFRAGFDVVGVDNRPQPRYPFPFIQADALNPPVRLEDFDAIHASPPCQAYSRLRHLPWLKGRVYPELIDATRELLQASGKPWIIENVEDAPLRNGVNLCGMMFGLPLYRHRRFESNILLMSPPHQKHDEVLAAGGASMSQRYRGSGGVTGVKTISRTSFAGHEVGAVARGAVARGAVALGIDWMRREELTQGNPSGLHRIPRRSTSGLPLSESEYPMSSAEMKVATSANTFEGDQRMKYGEYLSAPHEPGDPYCAHRYDGCLCGAAIVTQLMKEIEELRRTPFLRGGNDRP